MRVSRTIQRFLRLRFPITLRALPARLNLDVGQATQWLWGDYPPRLRSPKEGGPMKNSRAMVFIEVFLTVVAFAAIIASITYPVVEAMSRGT